jgi:hypothetical protein
LIIAGLKRRAALAVLLTALSVSLGSGLAFYLASVVAYGIEWLIYLDAPMFFAFASFFVTFPSALLMASVEWPKAKWLINKPNGGLWQQCWISAIAASVLPALITVIGWLVTDSKSSAGPHEWVGVVSTVPAFMLGGLLSAVIWWFVVVRYGRRIHQQNESGVIGV